MTGPDPWVEVIETMIEIQTEIEEIVKEAEDEASA